MVNLELYKPKQDILSLTDEELTLWYGKQEMQLIRLIGNLTVHTSLVNPHLITYKENNTTIMVYDVNSKTTIINDYETLITDNITEKCLRIIFKYQISSVKYEIKLDTTIYEPKRTTI